MKTPRRDVTMLDPSVKVPDGGGVPPLHVRALDAFEAFYRQLGVVSQRMAELRAAFGTDSTPWIVLTAASLNSALGVLYARLELLKVVTNDHAGRELWTHPMMELMRSQLRALLEDGTAYASRPPKNWHILQQLRHLSDTLAAESKIAREVVGSTHTSDGRTGDGHTRDSMGDHPGPRQRFVVIVDPTRPRTRCRMHRPWRHAWRRDRRLELP